MKLILESFLASLAVLAALVSGSVVVNEVELNPSGDGNEWVELYNSGEEPADIGQWSVSIEEALSSSGTWTGVIPIPKETSISPGSYYVVEGDRRWIHGNNGTVILRTDSWAEVDRTPALSDEEGNDFSWPRYPNGIDTDTRSDWAFIKATPGAENVLRAAF
ncbi:MAG: lamin tail domain-containing protein [Methanothrix sp.]|jgi:hypothetical protein|nr:lamin tail domain-containing protein [Methanothrix sp.]